jgi:hypothetical protein
VGLPLICRGSPDYQTHLSPVNISLPPEDIGHSPSEEVDTFIKNLRASVMKRVESIPAQPSQYVLMLLSLIYD